MLADAAALMEGTVTVLNRVPATRERPQDGWRATEVPGWLHVELADSSADGRRSPGATARLQVAEADAAGYVEPREYVGEGWTLRPGDVVAAGAVPAFDGTAEGMRAALAGTRSATLTAVRDLRLGAAADGLGGLSKWASVLYAEGV